MTAGEIVGNDVNTIYKNMPKKGKAVEIYHCLFDELWNLGDRKMPKNISLQVEEMKEGEDLEEQGEPEEEKVEEVELSPEEWDERIIEAFKRALIEIT